MTFKQTQYKGMDHKRMDKDYKKFKKQYMAMGNSDIEAAEKAKDMVIYYIHQYKIFK